MPTAYTLAVQEGRITEFRDFALQCARAYGACIDLRDQPLSPDIPDEVVPFDYHLRALEAAQASLAELDLMTDDEIREKASREHDEALRRHEESRMRNAAHLERYRTMLAKVVAWEPPSQDHRDLKDFMISQLEDSIRCDCGYEPPVPASKTASQWLNDFRERLKAEIATHKDGYEGECRRADERTLWLRKLKESLPKSGDRTE
jgi:hypothetical protein